MSADLQPGWLRSIPDPIKRAALALDYIENLQKDISECARIRAEAMIEAKDIGLTVPEIAKRLNVTPVAIYNAMSRYRHGEA